MTIILLMVSPFLLKAQVNEKWSLEVDSPIKWQKITSLGYLIVQTQNALLGVDTEKGEITWRHKNLTQLDKNSFKEIPQSPLITISNNEKVPNIFILEPITGVILFDSRSSETTNIDSTYLLYKSNMLLVHAKNENNKFSLIGINMTDGHIQWKIKDEFTYIANCMDIDKEGALIVSLFDIYKLNVISGEIEWKNSLDKKMEEDLKKLGKFGASMKDYANSKAHQSKTIIKTYYPPNSDLFVIGSQTESQSMTTKMITSSRSSSSQRELTPLETHQNKYMAYSTVNGNQKWKTFSTLDGMFGPIIFEKEGMIVCPNGGDRSRINLIEYSTGKKLWGKNGRGLKLKGSLVDYFRTKIGLLLITAADNKWSENDESQYFVNLLDVNMGTLKLPKYLKLRGEFQRTEILDSQHLIYITGSETNIINYKTGIKVFPKSVKTKPALTSINNNKIYIFSTKDKYLYEVDKTKMSLTKLSHEALKFEGKETPSEIETREKGIAIISDQNIALFDFNGKKLFQSYFPAPREPAFKRAMLTATAIRAGIIGSMAQIASAGYESIAEENENAGSKALATGIGKMYGDFGDEAMGYSKDAMSRAKARFKASTNSTDFIFMMIQQNSNQYGLARVSKDTGIKLDYIDMDNNKSPIYEVDNIINQVYYRIRNNRLVCYKF